MMLNFRNNMWVVVAFCQSAVERISQLVIIELSLDWKGVNCIHLIKE